MAMEVEGAVDRLETCGCRLALGMIYTPRRELYGSAPPRTGGRAEEGGVR